MTVHLHEIQRLITILISSFSLLVCFLTDVRTSFALSSLSSPPDLFFLHGASLLLHPDPLLAPLIQAMTSSGHGRASGWDSVRRDGYSAGEEKGWRARGGEGTRRAARVVGARRRPMSAVSGRHGGAAHATSPSPTPMVSKLIHLSRRRPEDADRPCSPISSGTLLFYLSLVTCSRFPSP